MIDWEGDNRRHMQRVQNANLAPKGLPREQLVPGTIVTHSASLSTGDRSGVEAVWGVVASNVGHVMLECVVPDYFNKFGDRTIAVISEHHFYLAEHMMDAHKQREKDKAFINDPRTIAEYGR